jgi:hypothetical protein
MKRIFLLSLLALFSFLLNAQSFEWAKGGTSKSSIYNEGIGIDSLKSLYFFNNFNDTVYFENQMIIPPFNNNPYAFKPFILKTDSSGNFIWAIKIWGQYTVTGHDISVAHNGDFVIVGAFYQSIHFESGSDSISLYSSNINREPFIAKFNTEGKLVFAIQGRGSGAQFGEGESRANTVELLPNGDFVVAGFFRDSISFGNTAIGSTSLNALYNRNIFLVKFSSEGEVLWATSASQPQHEYDDGWTLYSTDLCVDKDGNIFLASRLNGEVNFNNINPISFFKYVNYLTWTALIAKYNQDGKLLWAKSEGGEARVDPDGIACDKEGNLCFTGTFWQKNAHFGPFELTIKSPSEAFLVKFDTDGNVLWAKQTNSSLTTRSEAIAVDGQANVFITGNFKGNTTFGEVPNSAIISSPNCAEFFIAKYDSSGNFIWVKQSSGRNNGGFNFCGQSIVADNNRNLYVSGFHIGPIEFENVSIPWMNFNDVFIAKIKDTTDFFTVFVKEQEQAINLHIFPNPSNGNFQVLLQSEDKANIEIKVRNLTGAVIFQFKEQNSTGIFQKQIELTGATPGIYFIEVLTEKERLVKKVVVNK